MLLEYEYETRTLETVNVRSCDQTVNVRLCDQYRVLRMYGCLNFHEVHMYSK
jgi:hypothetical protein